MNNGKLLIADPGLRNQRFFEYDGLHHPNGANIEYTEPQCIKNASYERDKRSDVYSLGVLLWEITSGHPPFREMARELLLLHVGIMNHREQPVENTPLDYVKLYQKCWDKDPNLRPDIDKVYDTLTQLKSQVDTEIQAQNSGDEDFSVTKIGK